MNKDLHFSSEYDSWETPKELFNEMNLRYGPFDFDAAASKDNTKCGVYLGPDLDYDALEMNWLTDVVSRPASDMIRVWLNPPYSRPENKCNAKCTKKTCEKRGHCITTNKPGQINFIHKAVQEAHKGLLVCCLIPARTDTGIFHDYIWNREQRCYYPWVKDVDFLPNRIAFLNNGEELDAAPFPSLIVVFGPPNLPKEIK